MVNKLLSFLSENNKLSYNEKVYHIIKTHHDNFIDEPFVIEPKTLPEEKELRQRFLTFSPFMVGTKEVRKELIDLTLSIEVEENSLLCSGDGIIEHGSIMLVGMAPGFYNGDKYDLISKPFKPSFYFANTSNILRTGIKEIIDKVYFTNLSKIVLEKHRMNTKMYKTFYDKFFKIFQKEVNILAPRVIISLGNDVYNFLSSRGIASEKWTHPSFFAIRNQYNAGIEYYKEQLCLL